jgi:hypothetical protein
MTSLRRQRDIPARPPSTDPGEADGLGRMAVLLETADVLATRARLTADPVRRAELMRRAGQRRREAARLRESLVARGATPAVERPDTAPSPARTTSFSPVTPAVRRPRAGSPP